MPMLTSRFLALSIRHVAMAGAIAVLAGCAAFSSLDAPKVTVAGLSPLPSEGLELRFALKLRVQNPNDLPIEFDGVAVDLDIDGRGLASGVASERGQVPRYGEQVITVPVSISAFSALRQMLSRISAGAHANLGDGVVTYALSGKFGSPGGGPGALRFTDKGEMNLFAPMDGPVERRGKTD